MRRRAPRRTAFRTTSPSFRSAGTSCATSTSPSRCSRLVADASFARLEVARLEELHSLIVEDRVEAELALGRHRSLAVELPALVDAQPFREVRWAQLMRALYRSGRQADALRTFERMRRFFGEELGIEPMPWVRALEGAMLVQSPDLEWQPRPAHRSPSHPPRCRR